MIKTQSVINLIKEDNIYPDEIKFKRTTGTIIKKAVHFCNTLKSKLD